MHAHTRLLSITAKHHTGCVVRRVSGAVPRALCLGTRGRRTVCWAHQHALYLSLHGRLGLSLHTQTRSGHCTLQLTRLHPGCQAYTTSNLLVCSLAFVALFLCNAVEPGRDVRTQRRVTCSSSAHSSSCSRRSARAPSRPAAACSNRSSRPAQRATPKAAAAACRRSARRSPHRRPTDRQRSAGCGRTAMPGASSTGGGGGARVVASWSKSEADQAACRGAQAGMLCLHASRRRRESRACRTRQPRLLPFAPRSRARPGRTA
jgi:hypothetical protein